jgi:hypothetical protein
MMDFGKMVRKMDKEYIIFLMEIFMKAIGLITKNMVKAQLNINLGPNTVEIGKMIMLLEMAL